MPGAGRKESEELWASADRAAGLPDEKCSEDGWWRWVCTSMHILNVTDIFKKIKMINFMLCIFYLNKCVQH